MDTLKDTKMQPATDAVIEELRKVIADCYWPTSPVTIKELLDRLEVAEKEIALKERVIDALGSELNAVAKERDELRAKIAEMEKQDPVAWMHETRRDSDVVTDAVKHVWGKVAVGSMAAYSIPLYTLPDAQPAPSEQDESVRKSWARFSNELHRSPNTPYPGMAAAFEQHFSQSFTDRDWRVESGVWAAAWKAAKRHCGQPAPSVPREAINKMLTQLMDIAVSNGANSVSMPDAQNVPKAVAYLDLGTGGYMDIGTDLTDEALAALPKGRHMLGIVGTYGVDGYVPAQNAPSVPEGWLRAIDEALVVAHIGVANASDTYEQAKAKLDSLIGFHVDVATDPAVNGGFKLMPNGWEANLLIVEHAMRMNNWDWNSNTPDDLKRSAYKIISNLLAAPEAKS